MEILSLSVVKFFCCTFLLEFINNEIQNINKRHGVEIMDIHFILEAVVFVMILASIIATIWTYLTYKKEQMQSNLFLRYDYFRKSSLTFFTAIAIYLVMNSLDDLNVLVPTMYHEVGDIIVIILILISLYYFQAKVKQK